MKVMLLNRDELHLASISVTDPVEIESLDGEFRFIFNWPVLQSDLLRYSWDRYAGQTWADATTAIEAYRPDALNLDLARNSRIAPTYVRAGDKVALQELSGDWQLYEVITAETVVTGSRRIIRVECDHDYYGLANEELVSLTTTSDDATFALTQILSGTLWDVGTVEVTTSRTVTIADKNPLAALQQVVNNWGGELRFRVTVSGAGISGRYVDLLARRGDYTGKRFEFGHDLQTISININHSLVKTAMYGWGQGESISEATEDTERLDFADVEWIAGEDADLHPGGLQSPAPVDKPLGQKWVGDDDARLSYGRLDPATGDYRHLFGEYESQAKSPEALLWETWRQLKKSNSPQVNIEATVAVLEQITGREHESISLGDTCVVKVPDVDPLEARVIRIERNRLNPGCTVVELGNFRSVYSDDYASFQSRLSNLDGRAGIWDRAEIIGPDDTLPTTALSGVIDVVENQIKTGGGHVTIDGDGIWITDTDDPVTALSAVRGVSHAGDAAFVLGTRATVLDPWDFRVGLTSDGFKVFGEEIIGGKILTDLVRIEGDTSFYWNGQNLYAIDPANVNRQIRFGKYDGTNYGLAFTSDGGATWQAALTHDGLVVGSHSQFEAGYDPTTLDQFDTAAKDALAERFGYANYAQLVTETAGIGSTLISGGYINTDLIEAGAISAGMLGADIIDAGRIRADLIHIGTDTSYDALVKHTWQDYSGDSWQDAINSIQARLGGTLVPLHYDMCRSGVASPRDLDIGVLNGLEGLNLGSMAYEDAVERAKLGQTIIQGGYIATGMINASRIDTGTLNAARVSIGPGTAFAPGYDPSALDGLVDKDALAEYLGYTDYEDWKDTALAGNTIIDGGYINTSLIEAGSIIADYIGAGEIVVGHLGDTILSGGQIKTELIKIGAGTGYDAPQRFTWADYAGQTWSQAIATIETRVGSTPVWVLDMCRTAYFNPRELDHTTQGYFDALGNMAYENAVERAKLGQTIIQGGYLVTGLIDASRIDTGVLNAARVRIGSQTTFDTGYSPVAVRNEILGSLGDMAYEDAVEKAKLGTTLIDGGYIVTGLIDASRIDVGTINVNRISVLPDEKIGSAATWNSHDNTVTTIANGIITTGTIQVRQGGTGNIAAGITGALSGDTQIRIWAGQTFANRTSAPFRVSQAGALVATSATITGSITVTGGNAATQTYADTKATGAYNSAVSYVDGKLITLGDMAYEDAVEFAKLGTTIIDGGYIKTGLISASRIDTGVLNGIEVNGIYGSFTELIAGTGTPGHIKMDTNGYHGYVGGVLRARIERDRFKVYDVGGEERGQMSSDSYGDFILTGTDGYIPTRCYVGGANKQMVFDPHDPVYKVYFIGGGATKINGNLFVDGTLSKSAGSFKIDHPLDPDNKDLYHGFVEAPRYDLIYRGTVDIIGGHAIVDIDAASNMTPGTFEALTQNQTVVALNNLTGYSPVRSGEIVKGKFAVMSEDKDALVVAWVVVAERADAYVKSDDTDATDTNGHLIVEVDLKPGQRQAEKLNDIHSEAIMEDRNWNIENNSGCNQSKQQLLRCTAEKAFISTGREMGNYE